MKTTIYADNNATTPLDPQVLEAMSPYFREKFGNASSSTHSYGWTAQIAVEQARENVARCLGAQSVNEIIFTSGATESNNLAIEGIIRAHLRSHSTAHIISSPIEHPSVKEVLLQAQERYKTFGIPIEVDWVVPESSGRVDPNKVLNLIRPNTLLMSIMWVHNELGTINPIQKLAQIAHDHKIYFHCDATAAIGKVDFSDLSLKKIPVDILSLSAHKFYGPKGVGVLYVRNRSPKVQLDPLFFGGGQEQGFRSGTLNTPGIVGLSKALTLVREEVEAVGVVEVRGAVETGGTIEAAGAVDAGGAVQATGTEHMRLKGLRDHLWMKLSAHYGDQVRRNGSIHDVERAPHLLHLTFLGEERTVPAQISGLACSKSSACHSEDPVMGSHLRLPLESIGFSRRDIQNSLRISFGRFSEGTDPDQIFERIVKCI